MGSLIDKNIELVRSYIDPLNPSPIPSLDYNIVYPVTVYEAVKSNMDDNATTLEDELALIYKLIKAKQDPIKGGTVGSLMTWTAEEGVIGSTPIVKEINSDPTLRTHSNIPSERAVGYMIDLKGDASTMNAHIADLNAHITEDEKALIHNSVDSDSFNSHIDNSDIHITADERTSWNNKAEKDALDDHVKNTSNPHDVTAHQVGTYTRNEVDEMFSTVRETFFSHKSISYDESTGIAKLVEYDDDLWSPNYVLSYGDDLPTPTDTSLTYFALRPVTDYASNESNECMIYIKVPGVAWVEAGVQEMNEGDLVIRYLDTTMCVWVQGRFIKIFTDSAPESGSSILLWRPVITEDGILGWTKSSEPSAPDPVTIKGKDGVTPVKGVDYFDGAPGLGLPAGGTRADIMVKTTDVDYDTEWMSFNDFVERYFEDGGIIEGWISDWNNITNKPNIYNEKGDSEKDLVSQKFVSDNIDSIAAKITEILEIIGDSSGLGGLKDALDAHLSDYNNPHKLSASSVGAVSITDFTNHAYNKLNPHNVTAEQIGLGNVNNTSDLDKPISLLAQNKFDSVDAAIDELQKIINAGSLVQTVTWDPSTLTLSFIFRDGSELDVVIPIIDVFKSIAWDDETKELVFQLPDGSEHRVEITQLITTYTGSVGTHIKVAVEDGVIKATIIPHTISGDELVNNITIPGFPTTTTANVSDYTDKLATTKFVKDQVINDITSEDINRPLSAAMGKYLESKKASIDDVARMIADTPLMNITDNLQSTAVDSALSANMGRELNLTKAPLVHTSPSGSTFGRADADLFGHTRASSLDPLMDGECEVGTDDGYYARGDHRHPSDITKQNVNLTNTITVGDEVVSTVEDALKAINILLKSVEESTGSNINELVATVEDHTTRIGDLETSDAELSARMSSYEGKIISLLDDLQFSIDENGDLLLTY